MNPPSDFIKRLSEASTSRGVTIIGHPGDLCERLTVSMMREISYTIGAPIPEPSPEETIEVEWARFATAITVSGPFATEAMEHGEQQFAAGLALMIDETYKGDVYVGGFKPWEARQAESHRETSYVCSVAIAAEEIEETVISSASYTMARPGLFDRALNWIRRLIRRPERWGQNAIMIRSADDA